MLEELHSNLDENLLITLLKSSGWEEKNIDEALLVFRNQNKIGNSSTQPTLPPLEEEKILPEIIDASHELLAHNSSPVEEEALPQNLPISQPEDIKHLWPFSKQVDESATILPSKQKDDGPIPPHKDERAILTNLSESDEKLLLLAYASLFIILALLAYMYANARI
jgi:hypothetical protein